MIFYYHLIISQILNFIKIDKNYDKALICLLIFFLYLNKIIKFLVLKHLKLNEMRKSANNFFTLLEQNEKISDLRKFRNLRFLREIVIK